MATNNNIVCAYYNYGTTGLQPEDINGDILTHLIVGWAGVDVESGTCIPTSPESIDGFRRCTALRVRYPDLKVSLVCGAGSSFSTVANSSTMRDVFVQSAVSLLESCGFDGLDFDWEFPVFQGKSYDKANFVMLMQELRRAFDAHSPRFLLTFAAAAQKNVASVAYDIPALVPLVDWVNLMCYDYNIFKYYSFWAGHNAPLFRRSDQKFLFATLNTAWSADYFLEQGMPREKIVVGIPTYARAWKLLFSCWHSYNAFCVSSFDGGASTYPEVMELLSSGAKRVFDNQAYVPFAYKGRQWVSYEDEQSITTKSEFIRKNGFRGAMIFSLNHDDWKGVFSHTGQQFPLINIVYRIVVNGGKGKEFPMPSIKIHSLENVKEILETE